MLNNSSNFAHREMGDLFGRSFIKARSTDTLRKLSSIGEEEPDPPAKISSHVMGNRRSSEHPHSLEHPHLRGNGQSFALAGTGGYSGASSYGNGTTGGYQRSGGSDWASNNSRGQGSDGRGRGGYVKSISPLALAAPPLVTAFNPVDGDDWSTTLRRSVRNRASSRQ